MNRDLDDEGIFREEWFWIKWIMLGNVLVVEDPSTQSRVLVVNKGNKRQKEMYVIKEESLINTQSSVPANYHSR